MSMYGQINSKLFFINQYLNAQDSLSAEQFSKTPKENQLVYTSLVEFLANFQALAVVANDNKGFDREYLDEKIGRIFLQLNKNLPKLYNFVKGEDEDEKDNL